MKLAKVKILENRQLNKRYYLLSFSLPNIQVLPGQFFLIKVNESTDPFLLRPFSICWQKRNKIFLLYQIKGNGTTILSQREKGEEISILGPLGNGFEMPSLSSQPILIAGGIGVASLLLLYKRLNNKTPVLLWGGRSKEDVDYLYKTGFFKSKTFPILISTEDGTSGFRGKVTDLLSQFLEKKASKKRIIYSCGPKEMLKEVGKIGERKNVLTYLSLEEYIACGVGACRGCVVKIREEGKEIYKTVCKDGPSFLSTDIIWDGQ